MNNEIVWKVHKHYISGGGLPVDIIEFIYKDTSKILRVDSRTWEEQQKNILNWIKRNWNGIKTNEDALDFIVENK